jgi:hypothetical protein
MPTFIANEGDDFVVQYKSRQYNSADAVEALKVDGKTGSVTVNGVTVDTGGTVDQTARDAAAAAQSTADGAVSVNTTQTNRLNGILKPTEGAALTNADVTVNPATDGASEYTLPAATLTGNHTVTLGVTGSPITGTTVNIVRKDLTANTYAVINGGTNGGTAFTFASAPAGAQVASFFYNSVDWVFAGFQYVSVA